MSANSQTLTNNATGNNMQAILWVLSGTAVFSMIFASGKLLGGSDWVWQIIFFRYLSGLAVMIAVARYQKVRLTLSPKWPMHLSRALVGGAGGCAAIYAAANMAVADAAAIGLLDSVFAIILGMLIFRELVSVRRWLAISGCIAGAVVVLLDQGAFQAESALGFAALAALGSAIFLALESVLIRALAVKEDIIVVLLHVNFFGALLFAIPALLIWGETDTVTKLTLCLLGPLAILGQYCNIRGYRIANLSIVAPVGYSWIIFALAIDYLFFSQPLTAMLISGSALILLSGLYLAKTP
ncbi:MAG: hypothetical protein OFPI_08550 [Osedax symbiont Rs2]|nr:MAG: hypothetical protein OFPI_08550 [Osedax symbiont Rs2]